MKLAVSGSAPLAANITEFMHIIGVPVFEGYGLTETCAPVSVNLPNANRFGSVGKLLPEVLIKIADDGEILVKSAKNFSGYYKNPEATAEAIRDGWFYTGDIGELDEDGYLKITDRKKDLIKTAGGKFIAPQKIENLAKATRYLSQIVVYGDQKPFVVALVTVNKEAIIQYAQQNKILFGEYSELLKNTQVSRLIAQNVADMNQHLARYESIKRYHILPEEFTVDSGDLTPSLKVKRKYLTQKYLETLENMYNEEKA
jgi:long-chain acyl-CoA synthetase